MKPLLKPTGQPHAELLKCGLGISAVASIVGVDDFETSVPRILAELKAISSADVVTLEERDDQPKTRWRTYVLSIGDTNTGGGSFSFAGQDNFTMRALLNWSFLPHETDEVVAFVDRLWHCAAWRTLHAYDADDNSLQNCTMVLGMENWGLARDQVDFINRYGIVNEIDTRANPGYFLNHGGFYWSVQWLNYWSREAQTHMLAHLPHSLPP